MVLHIKAAPYRPIIESMEVPIEHLGLRNIIIGMLNVVIEWMFQLITLL